MNTKHESGHVTVDWSVGMEIDRYFLSEECQRLSLRSSECFEGLLSMCRKDGIGMPLTVLRAAEGVDDLVYSGIIQKLADDPLVVKITLMRGVLSFCTPYRVIGGADSVFDRHVQGPNSSIRRFYGDRLLELRNCISMV